MTIQDLKGEERSEITQFLIEKKTVWIKAELYKDAVDDVFCKKVKAIK